MVGSIPIFPPSSTELVTEYVRILHGLPASGGDDRTIRLCANYDASHETQRFHDTCRKPYNRSSRYDLHRFMYQDLSGFHG